MACREIGEHIEARVRAPVEISRYQLDLDPLLVVVLGTEILEQWAAIGLAQPEAREMALQGRPQSGRQALIDEPVQIVIAEGRPFERPIRFRMFIRLSRSRLMLARLSRTRGGFPAKK